VATATKQMRDSIDKLYTEMPESARTTTGQRILQTRHRLGQRRYQSYQRLNPPHQTHQRRERVTQPARAARTSREQRAFFLTFDSTWRDFVHRPQGSAVTIIRQWTGMM
jgi:hypothetical protein